MSLRDLFYRIDGTQESSSPSAQCLGPRSYRGRRDGAVGGVGAHALFNTDLVI